MIITAEWTDLGKAISNARALGDEIASEEVIEKALLDLGRELRDEIARSAPRSAVAPHMADEFVAKVSREERAEGRSAVVVGPRPGKGSVGFVATFIEFGTYKLAPRPFIRPTWDGWRGGFTKSLAKAIGRHYQRVVRKYVRLAGK